MKRQTDNKTVLFFRTGTQITNRRTYEGIYSYGAEHGWNIQTVRVDSISAKDGKASSKKAREQLLDVMEFWNPDGCIVMGDAQPPFRNHIEFGKTPVVFCDALPEEVSVGANVVSIDSGAIADYAARELLTLGMESFAYVGYPCQYGWCSAREKCFRKIIEVNGKSFVSARLPLDHTYINETDGFGRWLANLPKPTGVFAANDQVAEAVVNGCVNNGLSIPRDIAVVGVDNDEIICENASVAITSIVPDFRKAGWMSAQLLDEIMESPASSQMRNFGIAGIERRESTRKINIFDGMIMKFGGSPIFLA